MLHDDHKALLSSIRFHHTLPTLNKMRIALLAYLAITTMSLTFYKGHYLVCIATILLSAGYVYVIWIERKAHIAKLDKEHEKIVNFVDKEIQKPAWSSSVRAVIGWSKKDVQRSFMWKTIVLLPSLVSTVSIVLTIIEYYG